MKSEGFYKWASEGNNCGGPAPDEEPTTQSTPPEDLTSSVAPKDTDESHAEDLDIEKKWLQLVGLDSEKFDFFFNKYYDRIFNYAFWKTGNHDVAADVASEAFMLAWDRRRQFRWQGYSFGAWLFQIARSVVSHQHRWQQVRRETEFLPERHDQADETTPADVLDRKKDQELVRKCLELLAADPYEVIVLYHFVGMTAREIGLATKMPLGTVNSHLRRGKQVLRRCLEEHGAANGMSEMAQRLVRQASIEDSGLNVVDARNGEPDDEQVEE